VVLRGEEVSVTVTAHVAALGPLPVRIAVSAEAVALREPSADEPGAPEAGG
jgi:hypothetical protein